MSKQIKPPVLIATAIVITGVLCLIGYKVLMPPTTQKSAASVQSASYAQQQDDRLRFSAEQKAHMDRLPPYMQKAAENSSNQQNAARIPELLHLQQTDPSKLTEDQKTFLSHLPPYLKRVHGGGAPTATEAPVPGRPGFGGPPPGGPGTAPHPGEPKK